MEQIRYLTADDIVMANRAAVDAEATVNFALLELAVQLPQQRHGGDDTLPDVHMKAAVQMYSLVRKPPFSVGNKRTAVVSTALFYAMNGMWLEAEQGEMVSLPLDIEAGLLEPHEVAAQLKQWVHEIP